MVFDVKHFYSKTNPPYIRKYNNIPQEAPKTPDVFTGAVINGEIEAFYQQEAGDCRLLSLLKAISLTECGKEGIKNAVKSDGMGGAYVTFKGAKGNQKEFHITIEDFIKAEKDGIYSKGDDDVLAIELATVKYLKTQGRVVAKEGLDGHDIGELGKYHIAELLFGNDYQCNNYYRDNEIINILNIMEENPGKYAANFSVLLNEGDDYWGHALTLKGVEIKDGKKYVTFFDPHNSEDEKLMDYNLFLEQRAGSIRLFGIDPNENNRKLMNYDERCDESSKLWDELYNNDFREKERYFKRDLLWQTYDSSARNYTKSNVKRFTDYQRYEIIKDDYKKIISKMDKITWGWGYGKDKKAMIKPFVDSVAKTAQMYLIDENEIETFKNSCYKELDATFYTNEKKIIEAFGIIIPKIEAAKEKFYGELSSLYKANE